MIWIFGLTLTLYGFFTQDVLAQDLAHDQISELENGVVERQIIPATMDIQNGVSASSVVEQSGLRSGNNKPGVQPNPRQVVQASVSDDGFYAYATAYTRESSCHFRTTRNGREICPMASGKDVYVGAVACPRFLKLGTKIKVMDTTYTCEDRYSNRLDNIRGLPTIDIFMLVSNETAIKFGKRKVYVEIIKN